MSVILEGKKIAEGILDGLKKKTAGENISLAVVQTGKDPASEVFLKAKEKACKRAGIRFKKHIFPKSVSQLTLENNIKRIVKENSGTIVQLPLPKHIRPEEILNLIPGEKDPDVLSEQRFVDFLKGKSSILPPVAEAIKMLFDRYGIKVKGRKVVVVGSGRLTGFPSAVWALQQGGKVFIINEATKSPSSLASKADILISGTGKPGLINGNWVKKGAVVVDCGTNVRKGKLGGDVDFNQVSKKASFITPVPGGIGPLTVAAVLKNLVKLSQKR